MIQLQSPCQLVQQDFYQVYGLLRMGMERGFRVIAVEDGGVGTQIGRYGGCLKYTHSQRSRVMISLRKPDPLRGPQLSLLMTLSA